MQSNKPTALERAFSLARTGAFKSRSDISKALKREGYLLDDLAQLTGPTLSRQLRAICNAASSPAS